MKIIEYKILDEANPDLLKYISSVDSQASSLGNKLGIKPKTPNEVEQSEYEYNITDISFILKSTTRPNMFRSRKSTFSYAFYDNMLHIYGSRSSRDQLKIYFDYNGIDLKEIKTGVEYKVDRVEGQFQNIIGRESFDTFILMTPDKILKSIKINNDQNNDNKIKSNNNVNIKPNADVDLVISNNGKKKEIKGLVHLEARGGNNKYNIKGNGFDFIMTTDKPLVNRPNLKYKIKRLSGKDNNMNFDVYDSEMVVNKLKFL
mgnify:CR=1 FL=1